VDTAEGNFEWDEGNRKKCTKHGVRIDEIESAFLALRYTPSTQGHPSETRYVGTGLAATGRYLFLVFTIRSERIRVISARYMHAKEITRYEKKAERVSGSED
jgi:hypothetical protein